MILLLIIILKLFIKLSCFNAQHSGPLPKHNNVSWRGNSGMRDGLSDSSANKNLVGGYYDAGDAIKFNFPQSLAMTMLSWSVIEYSHKYEVVGELTHVKEIIKWGTDYLLKTFNNSADTIDKIYAQRIDKIRQNEEPKTSNLAQQKKGTIRRETRQIARALLKSTFCI